MGHFHRLLAVGSGLAGFRECKNLAFLAVQEIAIAEAFLSLSLPPPPREHDLVVFPPSSFSPPFVTRSSLSPKFGSTNKRRPREPHCENGERGGRVDKNNIWMPDHGNAIGTWRGERRGEKTCVGGSREWPGKENRRTSRARTHCDNKEPRPAQPCV